MLNKEDLSYKQIAFDLDTKKLEHYLGNAPIGYRKLGKVLHNYNFEHSQGSVYVSTEKFSQTDIFEIFSNITSQNLWLGECCNKINVTDVSIKQFDLLETIKKTYLNEIEVGHKLEPFIKENRDFDGRGSINEDILLKIKSPTIQEEYKKLLFGDDVCNNLQRSQNELLIIAGTYSNYNEKIMFKELSKSKLSEGMTYRELVARAHNVTVSNRINKSSKKAAQTKQNKDLETK